ncbi:MAG: hypothetical protein DMD35_22280 [Gemmatimonadetes bacterium]|nr:MAG: hypothetical protein DMD35_22280 [Gemmatimonadota bacterium]
MVWEELQYSNTVERRRPAWHGAMGRGSRDSHCSAHPLLRRAAGALHESLAVLRRARGAALTSRRRRGTMASDIQMVLD